MFALLDMENDNKIYWKVDRQQWRQREPKWVRRFSGCGREKIKNKKEAKVMRNIIFSFHENSLLSIMSFSFLYYFFSFFQTTIKSAFF
jgi:hypothetical protein